MTLLRCLFLDYLTSSVSTVYVRFPKSLSPIALNAPRFLFPLLSPYFYPRCINNSSLITIASRKGSLRCALFSCASYAVTVPLLTPSVELGYSWSRSALCVASDVDGLPTDLTVSDLDVLLEHLSGYVSLSINYKQLLIYAFSESNCSRPVVHNFWFSSPVPSSYLPVFTSLESHLSTVTVDPSIPSEIALPRAISHFIACTTSNIRSFPRRVSSLLIEISCPAIEDLFEVISATPYRIVLPSTMR